MTSNPSHRRSAVSTINPTKSQTTERREIKNLIDCLSERRLEPAGWFIEFIIASRAAADNAPPNEQNANGQGGTA